MSGRIRSIKPEILEDEKVAELSHLEFRLFVGSWLLADDYGNLRADPNYIRGQIVWASQESRESVAKALGGLARVSLLVPYRVRGQSYLHIRGWEKHQRVDKPGKPRMPGHDDPEAEEIRPDALDSRESRGIPANVRGSLAPDLRPPTSDQDLDHDHEREPQHGVSAVADASPLEVLKRKVDKAVGKGRSRKPKQSDANALERASALVVLSKLSAQNGVRYSGSEAHVQLIANRLRDGISEMDLRAVVGFCALEKGWKGDQKMEQYLSPETLFGPESIHRYLDPARTWFSKLPDDTAQRPLPNVEAEIEPGWMQDGGAA